MKDDVRFIKIIQFIEKGQFDLALSMLEQSALDEDHFGYQGLIYYLRQDFSAASKQFEQAIALHPSHHRWIDLLDKSKHNEIAVIPLHPPESAFDSVKKLESLYKSSQASYPIPRSYHHSFSVIQSIKITLGNVLGSLASWLFEWITAGWGKIGGYKDKIWTNWYRKRLFLGVLSLAYMRNQLNKKNLFATYTQSEKEYYKKLLKNKPAQSEFFRTYNGTYNNLDHPLEGAAGSRFQRNVSPASSNAISQDDILLPNPRWISRSLLTRVGEMKKAQHINMLAAAWIQFQNHDWVSHIEPSGRDCYSIDIDSDDPIRLKFNQSKLFVGKTPSDPTLTKDSPYQHSYINEVTHWWDGSQIYGSNEKACMRIRSFVDGKLILNKDGHLPVDSSGQEITGYHRNWWVGLSLFHTLFTLEHNAICDELKKHNSTWSDELLYHTARLINAALMAKIHTIEWNSAINPNEAIYNGNHSNWYGLLTTMFRKKEDWHTVANINIRNTELGGVIGNPIKKYNNDFGLTEEFVEAYRIHSMLPESLEIRDIHLKNNTIELPFASTRYSGSAKCIQSYGMPTLWYSLGNQNPGQVVLNNYPLFMQELSIPGNPVYDMGTVDLLRARERGVPRYNEFRRQLGLNPLKSLDDLTTDQEVLEKLKTIYGREESAIERLDFMIGTLAESQRPSGFAFGETMFQLFLLNATRRLQADRFYTDCYTEQYYTSIGMKWIDTHSLKDILLRHYPQLHHTGLANVINAFEPWDEDHPIDSERHPLRVFEKDLNSIPVKGNKLNNKTLKAKYEKDKI